MINLPSFSFPSTSILFEEKENGLFLQRWWRDDHVSDLSSDHLIYTLCFQASLIIRRVWIRIRRIRIRRSSLTPAETEGLVLSVYCMYWRSAAWRLQVEMMLSLRWLRPLCDWLVPRHGEECRGEAGRFGRAGVGKSGWAITLLIFSKLRSYNEVNGLDISSDHPATLVWVYEGSFKTNNNFHFFIICFITLCIVLKHCKYHALFHYFWLEHP